MSVSWRSFLKQEIEDYLAISPYNVPSMSGPQQEYLKEPETKLFSDPGFKRVADFNIGDGYTEYAFNAGKYRDGSQEGEQFLCINDGDQVVVVRKPDDNTLPAYTTSILSGWKLTTWLWYNLYAVKHHCRDNCAVYAKDAVQIALMYNDRKDVESLSEDEKSSVRDMLHVFLASFLDLGSDAPNDYYQWEIDVGQSIAATHKVPKEKVLCETLRLASQTIHTAPGLTRAEVSVLRLWTNAKYNPAHDVTTAWKASEYGEWLSLIQDAKTHIHLWEWLHAKAAYKAFKASGLDILVPASMYSLTDKVVTEILHLAKVKHLSVQNSTPLKSKHFKPKDPCAYEIWECTTSPDAGMSAISSVDQSNAADQTHGVERDVSRQLDDWLQLVNPYVLKVLKPTQLEHLKKKTPRFAPGSICRIDIEDFCPLDNTEVAALSSQLIHRDGESTADPGVDYPHWLDIARDDSERDEQVIFDKMAARCGTEHFQQQMKMLQDKENLAIPEAAYLYVDEVVCKLRKVTPKTVNGMEVNWNLLRTLRIGRPWTEATFKLIDKLRLTKAIVIDVKALSLGGTNGYAGYRLSDCPRSLRLFYLVDSPADDDLVKEQLEITQPLFSHRGLQDRHRIRGPFQYFTLAWKLFGREDQSQEQFAIELADKLKSSIHFA